MAVTTTTVQRRGGTQQHQIQQSAAGTDNAVLAAPGSGFKHVIVSLIATLDADGVLTLESGANPILRLDMAGKSAVGFKGSLREAFLELNANEALDVITSGGAAELTIVTKTVIA